MGLPVEVVHFLESISHFYDSILKSTLHIECWILISETPVELESYYEPRTVTRPSTRAPKFDIRGLSDTI